MEERRGARRAGLDPVGGDRLVVAGAAAIAATFALACGRPDLAAQADLWAEPTEATPVTPGAAVTATFLGVASVLLDDGETAVMTDGLFSRPAAATPSAASA